MNRAVAAIAAFMAGFILSAVYSSTIGGAECRAAGGVPVLGALGVECVQPIRK